MPAFGVSVDDFIAAIGEQLQPSTPHQSQPDHPGLITKVAKGLNDRAGAAMEYQHAQLELQSLERTLRHLQAMKPNEDNVAHVNAIRGMALTCRITLQESIQRINKFEASMGAFPRKTNGPLKSFGRKSQRAVVMSEEVTKLRTAIGAKVLSINLPLATHTSESISGLRTQARTSHVALMANILEQTMALVDAAQKITNTKKGFERHCADQAQSATDLTHKVDGLATNVRGISNTFQAMSTELMSLRSVGVQLLDMIHHLPQQSRETLEQVIRGNLQMYSMLRVIHASVLRTPSHDPVDTLRFEDVLA